MTPEQIADKYGIEPIMKEMWVWDEDNSLPHLMFVLYKGKGTNYPYKAINENLVWYNISNASETNPNDKEPKVGEKGYFWDDADSFYIFDVLSHRYIGKDLEFLPSNIDESFRYFSHEKQPWMK